MQVNPLWPVESRFPQLEKDLRADIVIVGGGMAGISCALDLTKRGYETILLEQDAVGSAASGASSGVLYYGSGTNYVQALELFGVEPARQLWLETGRAIKEIVSAARGCETSCGLRRCGSIMVAKTEEETLGLEREHNELHRIGITTELLSSDELRAFFPLRPFLQGLAFAEVAQVHPARFAAGVAKTQGLRLYENSPVTGWEADADRVSVRSPKGTVRASKLVLATNTQPCLGLEDHFEIESSVILASQSVEGVKSIWPEEKIIWSMEEKYDLIYPRGDRLILELYVLGDEAAKLAYYYPRVQFRIEHQWGDIWARPMDWMPIVGTLKQNVAVAIGMGDQGIIMSWLSAQHIADSLEGKSDWFLERTSPLRFGQNEKRGEKEIS